MRLNTGLFIVVVGHYLGGEGVETLIYIDHKLETVKNLAFSLKRIIQHMASNFTTVETFFRLLLLPVCIYLEPAPLKYIKNLTALCLLHRYDMDLNAWIVSDLLYENDFGSVMNTKSQINYIHLGSHGTHVAATLAAYDSTAPLHCGIAPGAQIVSVKIGDVRINGMETGAGIIRGVAAAVENKCHLINMSYGEATTIPNAGYEK